MKISKNRLFAVYLWFLLILLLAAPVQAKHILWQVNSDGHTLYLLGSLHVLKKDTYPLPAVMEEIYNASNTVVFETDMDQMDTPAMQKKIITYGRLPAGQTLQQQLSPQTWDMLQQKLAELNISETNVVMMRPWLCALSLTVSDMERQGFLVEFGLDKYFYSKAKKDQKKIIPLESVNYQLSLFYSQSRKEQEEFLRQTLTDLRLADTLSEEMESSWKNGEEEKLYQLIARSFADYPKQFDRLVLKRNKNWVPILERVIKKEKSSLVVVGAGHLVGPGSVVDKLRRKGYQVIQR